MRIRRYQKEIDCLKGLSEWRQVLVFLHWILSEVVPRKGDSELSLKTINWPVLSLTASQRQVDECNGKRANECKRSLLNILLNPNRRWISKIVVAWLSNKSSVTKNSTAEASCSVMKQVSNVVHLKLRMCYLVSNPASKIELQETLIETSTISKHF